MARTRLGWASSLAVALAASAGPVAALLATSGAAVARPAATTSTEDAAQLLRLELPAPRAAPEGAYRFCDGASASSRAKGASPAPQPSSLRFEHRGQALAFGHDCRALVTAIGDGTFGAQDMQGLEAIVSRARLAGDC